MKQIFANLVSAELSAAIDATQTTLTVTSATLLPVPGADEYWVGTIFATDASGNENGHEFVQVTGITGNTLTIVRGQEGTAGMAHAIGDRIELRNTSGTLERLRDTPIPDFGGAAIEDYTDKSADIAVTATTTTIDLAVTTARTLRLVMQTSTTLAFTNVPTTGTTPLTLICTQDATGGRTLTFPTGSKSVGGTLPTLSTAPGAEDWIEVVFHPALANPRVFSIGKGMA